MPLSGDPAAAVLEAYRAAVWAKDVDAYMALYAQDLHVFDAWDAWSCDDMAAWRAMTVEWFGSLGNERVAASFAEVKSEVSAELAVVHAFVTFAAIAEDGAALRSLDNRFTLTLRRVGEGWRIVHQHASSPIAPDTGKFRLKR